MARLVDGIGVGLDSALVVLRVIAGSNAEAGGVTVGCRLLRVNGEIIADDEALMGILQRCRDSGQISVEVEYANPVANRARPGSEDRHTDQLLEYFSAKPVHQVFQTSFVLNFIL